jgi:hypothetical protein
MREYNEQRPADVASEKLPQQTLLDSVDLATERVVGSAA